MPITKYLGRYLSGEYVFREKVEVDHRIQCVWMKFGQYKKTLCNRSVGIHLRLKLFDMVVTLTFLFGLAMLPLSIGFLQKITILQKKILTKIVGWVRVKDEPWENTIRRMNHCVEYGLSKYPIKKWNELLAIY